MKRPFWHFRREGSEKLAKGQSGRCLLEQQGEGKASRFPPVTPQFKHTNELVYIKKCKQFHLKKGVLLLKKKSFFGNPCNISFS